MRRNTVTLLKFLVAAVLCIMAIKYFTGGNGGTEEVYVDSKFPHEGGGGGGNKRALVVGDGDMKKIDWHNYKQIAEEKQRTGPGEQGQSVILDAGEEKKKADLYKVNGFNAFASDKISMHRSMKDIRHPDCKNKKYWNKLPTASVIVPFHNEHWSTLLRTAWSAVERSPPGLLKEVILVDDFSSKEFLKKQLDEYVAEQFKDFSTIVKVVRAQKREGLIRTRLLGAKAATGDVLIFLDSHCETNVNWLPPLLDPIQEDYKTVVCPFIDVVDYETFAYRAQDEGARGAFDWEFFYKRLPLRPEDLRQPAEPFNSPVMAGGLFAISAKWFWEMGGYDPGLDIWGGEQYELSFKIWQCGGKMIDAPCSRIGHIYRKFAPFANPGVGDFVGRNYKRVAEVWMDEYASYLYNHRPHYKSIDPGDLTAQKAIRQKLKCKPFKWFMKEVAFDLEDYYPAVEPPPFANGEVCDTDLEDYYPAVEPPPFANGEVCMLKCHRFRGLLPAVKPPLFANGEVSDKDLEDCYPAVEPPPFANGEVSVTDLEDYYPAVAPPPFANGEVSVIDLEDYYPAVEPPPFANGEVSDTDLKDYYPAVEPPPFANGEVCMLKCHRFRGLLPAVKPPLFANGEVSDIDLEDCYPAVEPPPFANGEVSDIDLEDYYPAVEPPPFANGEIRNVAANMCIDTRFKGQNERFSIEPCIKDGGNAGGEQNIEFTWHKDMRPGKRSVCFDVSQSIRKAPVLLYNCHGMKGNQRFKYNIDTKQIFHTISNQCLDCDPNNKEIFMNPCDQSSDTQKWKVEHVEEDKVKHEWGAP
ncbi:GALNT [Mytilus coruscus]|uniref:Polypeptide N-acetylgalactosaminyltransferase n=1 Tax=Mytilus coruscus TaxID=42192 RepID=A0A6J8CVX4_MYTCO|nr:GALNT [Mytilus coruscus]